MGQRLYQIIREQRLRSFMRRNRFEDGIAAMLLFGIFVAFSYIMLTVDWAWPALAIAPWLPYIGHYAFNWWTFTSLAEMMDNEPGAFMLEASSRVIGRRMAPEWSAFLQGIVDEAGVGKVQIYIIKKNVDPTYNAFATGTRDNQVMAINEALLEDFTDEEIRDVVLHELGHLDHADVFSLLSTNSMQVTTGLMTAVFFVVGGLALVFNTITGVITTHEWSVPGVLLLLALLCLVATFPIVPLLSAHISRRREEMADYYAVVHGGGRGLISAFQKMAAQEQGLLGYGFIASWIKSFTSVFAEKLTFKQRFGRWAMIQASFKKRASRNRFIFQLHPPLKKRSEKIERMLSEEEGIIPDFIEFGPITALKWLAPIIILIVVGNWDGLVFLLWFISLWWTVGGTDELFDLKVFRTDAYTSVFKDMATAAAVGVIAITFGLGFLAIYVSSYIFGAFALIGALIWFATIILVLINKLSGMAEDATKFVVNLAVFYCLIGLFITVAAPILNLL